MLSSQLARGLIDHFGQFQYSHTFKANDNMESMIESANAVPGYSGAFDADEGTKRHAACDECRKRKLRCSGGPTGCRRCIKQRLACHYSEQKQMGRPRKRRKHGQEDGPEPPADDQEFDSAKRRKFARIVDSDDRKASEVVCPGPFTQHIKTFTPAPRQPFLASGAIYEQRGESFESDTTPPSDLPPTPPTNGFPAPVYPLDVSLWPDYSTMLTLPIPVQERYEEELQRAKHSSSSEPSVSLDTIGDLPSTPACPCLANLYLTLSTLSTQSSFPVSFHTVETLQAAARTAHAVLHCNICPNTFQTGMQNVMLLGTLLTTLADNWHRIRKASSDDIRRGFSPAAPGHPDERPLSALQDLEWRTFVHHLIRANAFGDSTSPTPPFERSHPSPSPSAENCLMVLVEAMRRRQLQWHHPETATGEFPKRMKNANAAGYLQGMNLEEVRRAESGQDGYLCVKIVDQAQTVIKSLDREPPTL